MYERGSKVAAAEGAEVLADVNVPYFNRTPEHFCSHRHTPSAGTVGYPGVLCTGRVIYFAHPLFGSYGQSAPLWTKTLFLNALKMLLPERLVEVQGPSTLQVTVNRQAAANRLIAHFLHYIPERRGRDFDTIEEMIPLYNVAAAVQTSEQVKTRHLRAAGYGNPL
jgi:hypothetical protein